MSDTPDDPQQGGDNNDNPFKLEGFTQVGQPPEQQQSPSENAELPPEYAEPGAAALAESQPSATEKTQEATRANAGDAAPPADSTATEPLTPTEAGPLSSVKEFSENVGLSEVKATVPAALPFSLLIEGALTPAEREKLLDVLSRENMGIREVDLEPQLEGGKILIPRISEYAGVLLVQALRTAQVRMKLAPSDEIFSTADTADTSVMDLSAPSSQEPLSGSEPLAASASSSDASTHPAELIVVTPTAELKGFENAEVIDTVTASATLDAQTVEIEETSEFQQMLDNLQRELKYKAYRKGANAVVSFAVKLAPLSMPTSYRLIAAGVAIRKKPNDSEVETTGNPDDFPSPTPSC